MNGTAERIEMVKVADAAGALIKFKDDIHTQWFELQGSKRADQEHSFLERSAYDEIVRLGKEAINMLREADPGSQFIPRIKKPLNEVEWKSNVAEDITHIGPTVFYVMTPERGQEVITQDINRLANEIHQAGMSLIKAGEEYCGCNVEDIIEDISSINTGVLRYCEGALYRQGRVAWILEPGDVVEHRPGTVASHVNKIKFEPTEKGYNIDMVYTESGDENWRGRRDGVVALIKKKGGSCDIPHIDNLSSKCEIENASDETILDIALMLSQLKDVDLAARDCIPMAFELMKIQADELKKIEPKEEIWKTPWTIVPDFSEMMECQEGASVPEREREERRERRKALLEERLSVDIESLDEDIKWALHHSETDPCTIMPYLRLHDGNVIEDIRNTCDRIKNETDGSYGWCQSLANLREEEIKEAAKELVGRCPPEGIILGVEASSYPGRDYDLSRINYVCHEAGNEACLDIFKQVEARYKAGIKPAKLELAGIKISEE